MAQARIEPSRAPQLGLPFFISVGLSSFFISLALSPSYTLAQVPPLPFSSFFPFLLLLTHTRGPVRSLPPPFLLSCPRLPFLLLGLGHMCSHLSLPLAQPAPLFHLVRACVLLHVSFLSPIPFFFFFISQPKKPRKKRTRQLLHLPTLPAP